MESQTEAAESQKRWFKAVPKVALDAAVKLEISQKL